MRPTLLLVTPYLASANNGNWRTAARWARMLSPRFRVILQSADMPVTGGLREAAVALVALHARRSRAAIAAWKRARPERALIVALTGTDLYGDVPAGNADVLASIADADRLLVLQEDAVAHLPAVRRDKASVVMQSARALAPWPLKSATRFNALFVGHLRDVKDPRTALDAWRCLPADIPATLTLVGGAIDPDLADIVRRAVAADARVRWLGARAQAWTRQAIRRAHALVVSSRIEGGANVIVEALTAGTPVLATRISGNLGMLGAAYPGYFDAGDAAGLASLIERATRDRRWFETLARHGDARARRMTPAAETTSLDAAIDAAMQARGAGARMTGSRAPLHRPPAKVSR